MLRIIDLYRHIHKSVDTAFRKLLRAESLRVKKSTVNEQNIEYQNTLSETISRYLYEQPIGFLCTYRTNEIFLNCKTNALSSKNQNNHTKNNLEKMENEESAYIEMLSLNFSNNLLKNITRERVSINKLLYEDRKDISKSQCQ